MAAGVPWYYEPNISDWLLYYCKLVKIEASVVKFRMSARFLQDADNFSLLTSFLTRPID